MLHSQELFGRIPAQPHGGPARTMPPQQLPAARRPDAAEVTADVTTDVTTEAVADAVTDLRADAAAMAPAGS